MWVTLWMSELGSKRKIWLQIFTILPQQKSLYLSGFSGVFCPGFPIYFELIQKSLWYIFNDSEPEEGNYYDLFNNLIFAFDELLAVVDGKPQIVPFVEQSGQANVEIEEPRKKQKIE